MIPASGWKRILSVLALLGALAAAAQEKLDDRRQIFREIDRGLNELAAISGLKAKKSIRYDLITRDKVNEFLKDRVKETVKPEQLRAEEMTLKKIGFVPSDFNLEQSTVDLLTEQAAAFYDYHKKKLFLTDWASSGMQEAALVHELAHALADQHFRLERYIKQGGASDDSELARMAVMEGQATWLMTEAMARRVNQSVADNPGLLEAMSGSAEGSSQFPVFNSVPLYLRETLVFPYTDGARFQNAVYARMGKAGFSEVFRNPPETTQHILHPATYFDRLAPAKPDFPRISPGKGYKDLAEGMLGELDHAILIRQFGTRSQADSLAPHWRGGRYWLIEDKSKGRVILRYVSEWDSPRIAREFFRFYPVVLRKKWKKMEVTGESEGMLSGIGDDGHFLVRLDGNRVSSIEGLSSPDQAKAAGVR
ncbi:MAG TPA: hypothetical protein VL285_17500 [Bryobacteraceae bacterium]|nr:hypothetical protein [Bryobacteraceae bacterium]